MGTLSIAFQILLALCFTGLVSAGEYCRKYGHVLYSYTFYCAHGCCGSSYNRNCCSVYLNIRGVIIGSVIGGLVLIGIAVTVCICMQKKKARAGRVIQPSAPIIYNHTTGVYATQYPTAGGYNNPAYPPPYPGPASGGVGYPPPYPPPITTTSSAPPI